MIEIRDLCKVYEGDGETVEALKNINLTIADGEICGIIGMSGAGKSTLVRCMNMLERPTQGSVLIDGVDLATMNEPELRTVRRDIAMIFQHFNLLMQRTCLKNVCFPLELAGVPKQEAIARAKELLEIVGLPDKANAYPAQLSGGQRQRIAIARALATEPKVLLCDEATSALDPKTTRSILELIRDINKKTGITVVVITHQMSVVEEICHRVIILDDGCVVESGDVGSVMSCPHSEAARRLVFPGGADEILSVQSGAHLMRVIFHGADATKSPWISTLAIEKGIAVNILSASTHSTDDKMYGYMLCSVEGETAWQEAQHYLRAIPDITVDTVDTLQDTARGGETI